MPISATDIALATANDAGRATRDHEKRLGILESRTASLMSTQIRIEALRAASRVLQGSLELDGATLSDVQKEVIATAKQFAAYLETGE